MIFYGTDFLFFGGLSSKNIYKLDSLSFYWGQIGTLNKARHAHSVAIVDGLFLVVGGAGVFETERCKYSNDKIVCVKQEPTLSKLSFYPALMLVDDNFCK